MGKAGYDPDKVPMKSSLLLSRLARSTFNRTLAKSFSDTFFGLLSSPQFLPKNLGKPMVFPHEIAMTSPHVSLRSARLNGPL